MNTPLEIELPLDPNLGKRLLADIGAAERPAKLRKHTLTDETSGVQAVVLQPGRNSPSGTVVLRLCMDMSSLVTKNGFTANVVRKFVSLLARVGVAAVQGHVSQQTLEALENFDEEEIRVVRLSGSYVFDFKSESAALDAYFRLIKHLDIRLNCVDRWPGGRQSHSAPTSRLSMLTMPRHAFTTELIHYPFREVFGQARISVARDAWDMPAKLLGDRSEESRKPLFDRVKQLLRIDVTADAGAKLPSNEEEAFVIPARMPKFVQMERNPFEEMWTGFTWAAWVNQDFANQHSELTPELSNVERELLDIYLQGGSLRDHFFISRKPEMLLEVRKLLLRKAKVDVLVPWAAASLCEASWLKPRLDFANRLDASQDPLLAPYCFCASNAEEAAAAFSTSAGTGSKARP
jgi:hypothetical protein